MVKSIAEAAARQANYENQQEIEEREERREEIAMKTVDPNVPDASEIYDDKTGEDLI